MGSLTARRGSASAGSRSCEFVRLVELRVRRAEGRLALRRRGKVELGGQEGLQVHRTRTPSFITFLRVFFPLLYPDPVGPPRTFRFSSSSSSLANAHVLPRLLLVPRPYAPFRSSLRAPRAVVNISPRQVDRRGCNLLCYSLHARVTARLFRDGRGLRAQQRRGSSLYGCVKHLAGKLHLQFDVRPWNRGGFIRAFPENFDDSESRVLAGTSSERPADRTSHRAIFSNTMLDPRIKL